MSDSLTPRDATQAPLKPIRTYAVKVDGFPEVLYSARSPAKARARCWSEFTEAYEISFKDFLGKSTVRRADDPPGIGKRILVEGRPATRCIGYGHDHYVHFMHDDSDVVLCSHPADVEEVREPDTRGDSTP
jgi:hypothetical protein